MRSSISEFRRILLLEIGDSVKLKIRMANSVDPDETARYEPSHQDLHTLHLFCSAGLKRLNVL